MPKLLEFIGDLPIVSTIASLVEPASQRKDVYVPVALNSNNKVQPSPFRYHVLGDAWSTRASDTSSASTHTPHIHTDIMASRLISVSPVASSQPLVSLRALLRVHAGLSGSICSSQYLAQGRRRQDGSRPRLRLFDSCTRARGSLREEVTAYMVVF